MRYIENIKKGDCIMGIGSILAKLLEEKGMTAADLARLADVKVTTIYSIIKRNNTKVDLDILIRISNVLNVPVEYFHTGKYDSKWDQTLPPLTHRDEREIARDLEKMLADLDDQNGMAAMGGTVEDNEDRELLKASLLTSMQLAKRIAKKKFTPKKYRTDNKE